MKQEKRILNINSFYYYANEYRKNLTNEDEIEKIDMTPIFLKELETHIKEGEVIKIQVNAKPRLGKSTMSIAIGHNHIYELLKQAGYRKKNERFGMKNIARDQQEYSKKMRNPELFQDIIIVDEDNYSEKTGENSSTENNLLIDYSNIQAGRYIHTIFISPNETNDANADIILSIYYMDKERQTIRAKLYYKYYEAEEYHKQLLGYIEIYVGNIIENWNKEAKKLFFKPQKTKQENERLEEISKKDFYVMYMIKKYEKMDLINKEGIFKPRVLDYAETIIKVVEKLKPLTKVVNLVNHDIIRNYIKIEFKNNKIPTSIIGEELATREAQGLIDLYKAQNKISQTIIKNKLKNKPIKEEVKILEEISKAIEIQTKEYEHYAKINKKYHETQEE